ncbi:MAG TPA: hypothetical protein VFS44_02315 [Gemmatimonadaceae bacterium]|nr:hypothetical protein [Gemmatimonadaceae bacterium]
MTPRAVIADLLAQYDDAQTPGEAPRTTHVVLTPAMARALREAQAWCCGLCGAAVLRGAVPRDPQPARLDGGAS